MLVNVNFAKKSLIYITGIQGLFQPEVSNFHLLFRLILSGLAHFLINRTKKKQELSMRLKLLVVSQMIRNKNFHTKLNLLFMKDLEKLTKLSKNALLKSRAAAVSLKV